MSKRSKEELYRSAVERNLASTERMVKETGHRFLPPSQISLEFAKAKLGIRKSDNTYDVRINALLALMQTKPDEPKKMRVGASNPIRVAGTPKKKRQKPKK